MQYMPSIPIQIIKQQHENKTNLNQIWASFNFEFVILLFQLSFPTNWTSSLLSGSDQSLNPFNYILKSIPKIKIAQSPYYLKLIDQMKWASQ